MNKNRMIHLVVIPACLESFWAFKAGDKKDSLLGESLGRPNKSE